MRIDTDKCLLKHLKLIKTHNHHIISFFFHNSHFYNILKFDIKLVDIIQLNVKYI